MLIADFSLGDALLVALEIFFLVLYLWILFAIIGDLFRDHEVSGWGKAGWIFVLFLIPFLGALIYLIARATGCASAPSRNRRRPESTWTPTSARRLAARRPMSSTS